MATSLDRLLAEADTLIEKRAGSPAPQPAPSSNDDEVTKLAALLEMDEPTKIAAPAAPQALELTPFEKAASAVAIVETLLSMDQLQKVAEFEKNAKEKGFTDEQINDFIEKKAMMPVNRLVDLPGLLAEG